MSTQRFQYDKARTIYNGTTTVIYGLGQVKKDSDIDIASVRLCDAIEDVATSFTGYETRGVAKLDPEDTYSVKIGAKVASYKAEITGAKLFRQDLKQLLALVKSYENIITDTITELSDHIDKLQEAKARCARQNASKDN